MGNVTGCYVGAGRHAMGLLVIKEYVGLIGLQEFGLIEPAQENRLVNTNIPGAKGSDDALMGWR